MRGRIARFDALSSICCDARRPTRTPWSTTKMPARTWNGSRRRWHRHCPHRRRRPIASFRQRRHRYRWPRLIIGPRCIATIMGMYFFPHWLAFFPGGERGRRGGIHSEIGLENRKSEVMEAISTFQNKNGQFFSLLLHSFATAFPLPPPPPSPQSPEPELIDEYFPSVKSVFGKFLSLHSHLTHIVGWVDWKNRSTLIRVRI